METNRPQRAGMLYQNTYVWFIFLSCLDIFLTWCILYRGVGFEANALAAWVIAHFGRVGMVLFKLGMVVLIILICETVGRRNRSVGHNLARAAIALTSVPLVIAVTILATH
jgi:hypothetical protein